MSTTSSAPSSESELRRRRAVRDLKLSRFARTPEQQRSNEESDRSSDCEGYCALLVLLVLLVFVRWAWGDTYWWFTHLNEA